MASWLLDCLIERLHSEQQEVDPLTKLRGRRYMDSVLQMETKVSLAVSGTVRKLLVQKTVNLQTDETGFLSGVSAGKDYRIDTG